MSTRGRLGVLLTLAALATASACGGDSGSGSEQSMTLYTCVSDTTIQPVIDRFESDHPGTEVRLYRAPTGDLNARVAGDVRSGGLRADAIWGCDPLTVQDYVDQGLVGGWAPDTDIAGRWRTDDYVGVAVLYMVAVSGKDVPAPQAWTDLTGEEYADAVAVPDPSFAASALGALGYFAQDPDYGVGFYASLRDNGAKQVSTPDDVVNDVAEGGSKAGITIASSAYAAKSAGSPIQVVWPEPGAVAIYGPIALSEDADHATTAKTFISYVTSDAGQRLIGESGSYPTLTGVAGPPQPAGAPVVYPDWQAIATQKDKLLAEYQQIFGG